MLTRTRSAFLISTLLFARSQIYVSSQIPPYLTLENFVKILDTESPSEFNPTDAAAKDFWEESLKYEWSRAIDEEDAAQGSRGTGELALFPFLICNGNQLLSGIQRRNQVEASLKLYRSSIRTVVVYNEQDYTCFINRMLSSVALNVAMSSSIASPPLVVQPMTYAMKIVAGSVAACKFEDQGGVPTSMEVLLCPGILENKDDMGQANSMPKAELRSEVIDTIRVKDIYDGKSDAAKKFFWSILEEGDAESERAKFWSKVFEDGVDSSDGVCDNFYELVIFSFYEKSEADGGLSAMIVDFDSLSIFGNALNPLDQQLAEDCVLGLLISLSLQPQVCSLQVKPKVFTRNVNAQYIVQSRFSESPDLPWYKAGLKGGGEVVAVSDTGVDINNCYFWDDSIQGKSFVKSRDVIDMSQRKIVQYDPYVDDRDSNYGHGTHVVGTICGERAPDGVNIKQGAADGVARKSKVAFIDIGREGDGSLSIPPPKRLLGTGRPIAHIHSVSWGSEYNGYGINARNMDAYMNQHDDLLVIVAAGNAGDVNQLNTVGDPATAKNVLTVGASHSTGTDLKPGQLGPQYIAKFSSRGPTADGRTKPDVIAPGSYILSAGARASFKGECDPINRPLPDPGGFADGLLSLQGTSMATPVVAATAALVREYFMKGFYPSGRSVSAQKYNPSAALVKAVLINGAQYLLGVDNGDLGITPVTPYDNVQNFGRVSLLDSLFLGSGTVRARAWDRKTIRDGEVDEYMITIDEKNGNCRDFPVRATLVWSDPPSLPGCTSCVLNDLDLHAVDLRNNTMHYPNGLTGKDRKNNVERVEVSNLVDGDQLKVTVNAFNLATKRQNYALVVTGCVVTSNALPGPVPAPPFIEENFFTWWVILLITLGCVGFCCCCCVGGLVFAKRRRRR